MSTSNVQEPIQSAKDTVTDALPTPPDFSAQASPQELKQRLDWGEPALTIVDVRDLEAFNTERITGAVRSFSDSLAEWAQSNLEYSRDIYVYGDTDEASAEPASQLRKAGFSRVAELKGGLAAWKAIDGPTEGRQG